MNQATDRGDYMATAIEDTAGHGKIVRAASDLLDRNRARQLATWPDG